MKLTKITTVAVALAAAAVLATSAHAQTYASYNSGDLLLGFEESGVSSDYLVDLGSANNFITPASSTLTFQLSTTDLSSIFGSSWATNPAPNSALTLEWGVVGNDQNQTVATDGDGNTIFYTKGETVVGTQTTAPIRGSSSTLGNISNAIQNLDTGSGGYFNHVVTTSTAGTAHQAVIQTIGVGNTWSSFGPGSTGFGTGSSIEQPGTGAYIGATDSVLDLYEVDTKTGSNQAADFLGTFSLSSGGLLTFTEAQAVPEPSAYALGITALILFLVLKRRKALASTL